MKVIKFSIPFLHKRLAPHTFYYRYFGSTIVGTEKDEQQIGHLLELKRVMMKGDKFGIY
jgi:hypothetical protein